MDEPFGALDAQTRAQMQSYLLEIWRNVDVTILFITHDLDQAVYLSDRILVLGTNPSRVAEMIEDPSHARATARSLSSTLPRHLPPTRRTHPSPVSEPHDRLPITRMTMVGDDVE